jgi:hypothetical protein
MAHVKVYRDKDGSARLELNGVDFTDEVIADSVRITSTGDGEFDEVCIDMRIALSRLDIGDHEDVDAALLVGSSLARMAGVR